MIGRNEEGQITFNVDDREEVIASLKEVPERFLYERKRR